ncbi:MAG: MarR family transcriptional regulator [Ruminococcus sp.]|nr:MarR family transcriptional regulator [Ruminococcus sp.]MDE6848052.1 MarR family transcriptional regulator [Ruminococcus sp.]
MKEFDYVDMLVKMQEIRLFASINVRRTKKGKLTSSQELDILSRIVLADSPMTPMDLSLMTGLSKSSVSQLIDKLEKKNFLTKEYSSQDKRSYILLSTDKGKTELEMTYRYYLEPIYKLRKTIGEERFETLIEKIREANDLLQNRR